MRTFADIAKVTALVEATRCASSHALNDRSSRSHAIVKAYVSRKDGSKVITNTMTFVDLAGSERIKKSESTGQRQDEAISINTSLTVLGRCVSELGKGSANVPYRECSLTKVLKGSFEGGKTKISVVICLSREDLNIDESTCSCRFGARMGNVKNEARA